MAPKRSARRKDTPKTLPHSKGKRGRKPIFTGEQKRVLDRLIRTALKEQLRGIVKGL